MSKPQLKNTACLIFQILFAFPLISAAASTEECLSWFKNSGLKKGPDCLLDCGLAETDMGTFHCSAQCESLCKKEAKKPLYWALSNVYPGLTKAERELATAAPKKMLVAYQLTWTAENLCLNIFEDSDINDESDACRHFVWAALLYKKFGLEFSKKVLDAHEARPKQPSNEKAMDLANNQIGLAAAAQLLRTNNLEKREILKSFQKNLRSGKLVILKPGAKRKSSKSDPIQTKKLWDKLGQEKYEKPQKQINKEEK